MSREVSITAPFIKGIVAHHQRLTNYHIMDKMEEEVQDVDLELEEESTELLDEGIDDDSEEETVTIPKKKFKTMQYKAIAYDAKDKPKKPLKTREPDDELVTSVKKLEMIEAKRQFGYENSLSPEETDFIFKFSNGKPDKTVLENPFVKSGLEGFRASKRIEANTPGSTSRSPIFQGKDFKEMSDDERRKSFEASAKSKGFA